MISARRILPDGLLMPLAKAGLWMVIVIAALFAIPSGSGAAPMIPAIAVSRQIIDVRICYTRCIRYKRTIMNRRSCIALRRTCLGR
jgi:hypothetical protein